MVGCWSHPIQSLGRFQDLEFCQGNVAGSICRMLNTGPMIVANGTGIIENSHTED